MIVSIFITATLNQVYAGLLSAMGTPRHIVTFLFMINNEHIVDQWLLLHSMVPNDSSMREHRRIFVIL